MLEVSQIKVTNLVALIFVEKKDNPQQEAELDLRQHTPTTKEDAEGT